MLIYHSQRVFQQNTPQACDVWFNFLHGCSIKPCKTVTVGTITVMLNYPTWQHDLQVIFNISPDDISNLYLRWVLTLKKNHWRTTVMSLNFQSISKTQNIKEHATKKEERDGYRLDRKELIIWASTQFTAEMRSQAANNAVSVQSRSGPALLFTTKALYLWGKFSICTR